jgi:hypothetical protein
MSVNVLWSLALLALACEYVDSTLGIALGNRHRRHRPGPLDPGQGRVLGTL